MKIYTRQGDEGTSDLGGGRRQSKASPLAWALGELDELNSAIGFARSQRLPHQVAALAGETQAVLLAVGAELVAPSLGKPPKEIDLAVETAALERSIDAMDKELPELRRFILPGGSPAGAALHVARTVCRRAERSVVDLNERQPVRPEVLAYLNRLSDWLFTAARWTNRDQGAADVEWEPR